jgi:hypothetical protein
LPLVDFSDPAIQGIVTPQQQSDLSDWLCGAAFPQLSLIFDGVNEVVTAPNSALYDFNNTAPFTISIWFKTSDVSVLRPVFSKRVNINKGYLVEAGAGQINFRLHGSNTNFLVTSAATTLLNNTWYHLVVTKGAGTTPAAMKTYLNTALLATTNTDTLFGNTIQSGAAIAIGRNAATGLFYFLGNLGYIRIWNIEFDQTQVTTDYNDTGFGGEMLEDAIELANLVFGWKGGQDARWSSTSVPVFADEAGTNTYPAITGANFEFADISADIP